MCLQPTRARKTSALDPEEGEGSEIDRRVTGTERVPKGEPGARRGKAGPRGRSGAGAESCTPQEGALMDVR